MVFDKISYSDASITGTAPELPQASLRLNRRCTSMKTKTISSNVRSSSRGPSCSTSRNQKILKKNMMKVQLNSRLRLNVNNESFRRLFLNFVARVWCYPRDFCEETTVLNFWAHWKAFTLYKFNMHCKLSLSGLNKRHATLV